MQNPNRFIASKILQRLCPNAKASCCRVVWAFYSSQSKNIPNPDQCAKQIGHNNPDDAICGKVALITGGAQGIGFDMAQTLLRNGLKSVTIADNDCERGKKACLCLCEEFGTDSAMFCGCNVMKPDNMDCAFRKTMQHFKQVDLVINNAGVMNDKKWESEITVNIGGCVIGSLLGLQYMSKSCNGKGGIVMNIANTFGMELLCGCPIYAMTQSSIVGFTRALGSGCQYPRTGVKVMGLCAGPTNTRMIKNLKSRAINEHFAKELLEALQGRHIQPKSCVSEALLKVLSKGETGSIWVAHNCKEAFQICFTDCVDDMARPIQHKEEQTKKSKTKKVIKKIDKETCKSGVSKVDVCNKSNNLADKHVPNANANVRDQSKYAYNMQTGEYPKRPKSEEYGPINLYELNPTIILPEELNLCTSHEWVKCSPKNLKNPGQPPPPQRKEKSILGPAPKSGTPKTKSKTPASITKKTEVVSTKASDTVSSKPKPPSKEQENLDLCKTNELCDEIKNTLIGACKALKMSAKDSCISRKRKEINIKPKVSEQQSNNLQDKIKAYQGRIQDICEIIKGHKSTDNELDNLLVFCKDESTKASETPAKKNNLSEDMKKLDLKHTKIKDISKQKTNNNDPSTKQRESKTVLKNTKWNEQSQSSEAKLDSKEVPENIYDSKRGICKTKKKEKADKTQIKINYQRNPDAPILPEELNRNTSYKWKPDYPNNTTLPNRPQYESTIVEESPAQNVTTDQTKSNGKSKRRKKQKTIEANTKSSTKLDRAPHLNKPTAGRQQRIMTQSRQHFGTKFRADDKLKGGLIRCDTNRVKVTSKKYIDRDNVEWKQSTCEYAQGGKDLEEISKVVEQEKLRKDCRSKPNVEKKRNTESKCVSEEISDCLKFRNRKETEEECNFQMCQRGHDVQSENADFNACSPNKQKNFCDAIKEAEICPPIKKSRRKAKGHHIPDSEEYERMCMASRVAWSRCPGFSVKLPERPVAMSVGMCNAWSRCNPPCQPGGASLEQECIKEDSYKQKRECIETEYSKDTKKARAQLLNDCAQAKTLAASYCPNEPSEDKVTLECYEEKLPDMKTCQEEPSEGMKNAWKRAIPTDCQPDKIKPIDCCEKVHVNVQICEYDTSDGMRKRTNVPAGYEQVCNPPKNQVDGIEKAWAQCHTDCENAEALEANETSHRNERLPVKQNDNCKPIPSNEECDVKSNESSFIPCIDYECKEFKNVDGIKKAWDQCHKDCEYAEATCPNETSQSNERLPAQQNDNCREIPSNEECNVKSNESSFIPSIGDKCEDSKKEDGIKKAWEQCHNDCQVSEACRKPQIHQDPEEYKDVLPPHEHDECEGIKKAWEQCNKNIKK